MFESKDHTCWRRLVECIMQLNNVWMLQPAHNAQLSQNFASILGPAANISNFLQGNLKVTQS